MNLQLITNNVSLTSLSHLHLIFIYIEEYDFVLPSSSKSSSEHDSFLLQPSWHKTRISHDKSCLMYYPPERHCQYLLHKYHQYIPSFPCSIQHGTAPLTFLHPSILWTDIFHAKNDSITIKSRMQYLPSSMTSWSESLMQILLLSIDHSYSHVPFPLYMTCRSFPLFIFFE